MDWPAVCWYLGSAVVAVQEAFVGGVLPGTSAAAATAADSTAAAVSAAATSAAVPPAPAATAPAPAAPPDVGWLFVFGLFSGVSSGWSFGLSGFSS